MYLVFTLYSGGVYVPCIYTVPLCMYLVFTLYLWWSVCTLYLHCTPVECMYLVFTLYSGGVYVPCIYTVLRWSVCTLYLHCTPVECMYLVFTLYSGGVYVPCIYTVLRWSVCTLYLHCTPVECMYFVCTCMPGGSYRRRLSSLLYLCCVFRALINSPCMMMEIKYPANLSARWMHDLSPPMTGAQDNSHGDEEGPRECQMVIRHIRSLARETPCMYNDGV